jgi:zinc protease
MFRTLLFSLHAILLFQVTGEVVPSAWPQKASDIPPDARLHFGQLANGLRHVTMKHAEPPGRVSIRLYVHAGSLMEKDNQRGLAHFLEHMAFNGTSHFKGTEIVEFLQRLGMAFGPDINAHTSFDETVYKLDLPDVKEETIDQGLTIMRDWADGMLLDPEEIDRERGVIMKEKLGRDSIRFRLMEAELDFLFPDSLIPKRMPIGVEDVIEKAPQERFKNFYQTFYRPDRMVLVVVGDIDRPAIETKVKALFADMKPANQAAVEPALGKLTNTGIRARVEIEPEASAVGVSVTALQPFASKPDNEANRIAEFPLRLANAMINRRFSILAKKPDAPFTSGGAYSGDFFKFADMSNVELSCQPEQWVGTLGTVDKEVRRAVQHGFTEAELKEAKAELLNAYERAVETYSTEKAPTIANAIVSSFGDKAVFSSPQDDLRIASKAMETITVNACQEAFKKQWGGEAIHIMVSGNLKDSPTSDQVTQTFLASRQESVAAPVEEAEQAFAYREIGPPGQVKDRKVVEDLGITQLSFANGVTVNLKPTDFEDNTIRLTGIFGAGKLSQPKEKPGIDLLTQYTFDAAGLEKHSADDLQRLFAGKNVSVSFSIDEGHFELSGKTTPEDLLDQLQLMCAYLTAPGYRKEAEQRIRKMYPMIAKQITSTPNGVMQAKVDRFVHGGDTRFGMPEIADIEKLTLADVKQWIDEPLKNAPLEFSMVGEFEPSEVIPMLQSTFGALPTRTATPEVAEADRRVSFPTGDSKKLFPYESKLGKSMVLVYWPTTDRPSDITKARRLSVVANVLADRLRSKIREELGEAYSPGAHNVGSDTFPGYGTLFAMSPGSTEKAQLVADRIVELGTALSEKGTDADEFTRSLKPILTSLKEQTRNNRYWLSSVLSQCQKHPERLDWARNMTSDFESITVDDINALAKEYLAKGKSTQVLIVTE